MHVSARRVTRGGGPRARRQPGDGAALWPPSRARRALLAVSATWQPLVRTSGRSTDRCELQSAGSSRRALSGVKSPEIAHKKTQLRPIRPIRLSINGTETWSAELGDTMILSGRNEIGLPSSTSSFEMRRLGRNAPQWCEFLGPQETRRPTRGSASAVWVPPTVGTPCARLAAANGQRPQGAGTAGGGERYAQYQYFRSLTGGQALGGARLASGS